MSDMTEEYLKEISLGAESVAATIISEIGLPEAEDHIIPWSEYVAKLSFSVSRAMYVEKYNTQTKH